MAAAGPKVQSSVSPHRPLLSNPGHLRGSAFFFTSYPLQTGFIAQNILWSVCVSLSHPSVVVKTKLPSSPFQD